MKWDKNGDFSVKYIEDKYLQLQLNFKNIFRQTHA